MVVVIRMFNLEFEPTESGVRLLVWFQIHQRFQSNVAGKAVVSPGADYNGGQSGGQSTKQLIEGLLR